MAFVMEQPSQASPWTVLKYTLISAFLISTVLGSILIIIYKSENKTAQTLLETSGTHTVNLQVEIIEASLAPIVSDLMFLSEQNELQTLFARLC